MPISLEDMDVISRTYVDIFLDFEQTIINDIARRLAGGMMTETAAWQLQRLSESGSVYKKVMVELSQLTGMNEKELRKLFSKAGVMALRYDDSVYKKVGLKPLPLNQSPAAIKVLDAAIKKTQGVIQNLSMTTAYRSQQAYIKATNLAYMQVSTGTMDYNSAIRSAIKSVGESGLAVVYPSGHVDKLDVAIRRSVLTGVAQTGHTLQIERAKEVGWDLVQTSKHIGSRPSHAEWEGKIFSLSGNHPKYPKFDEATGYGTVTGLGGANCRHSFYPYLPDESNTNNNPYDKAVHRDYDKKKVTYNDNRISVYDATQKQRELERNIRKFKRQRDALEAAGLDNTLESMKVRDYQAELRNFVDQTKLQRQPERERT